MAKYSDSGYKFLMSKVTRDADGGETVSEEIDIEEKFPGLVYKQCTGLEAYGKPRPYEETYAESDEAYVHVAEDDPRDQTDITLTLYFFSPQRSISDEEKVAAIDNIYHSFMAYVAGHKIIYRDTARKRKVKMYLTDSTDPKTDRLYGTPYKEVEFKFKNIYGRPFGYDEDFPSDT